MSVTPAPQARRPSVGAGLICFRDESVLLIRRAKPPLAGQWSIPGGHVEWGETAAEAALREAREETGIVAEIVAMAAVIDAIAPGDDPESHFVLVDYAARWVDGEPRPGDDASEAVFAPLSALDQFRLWNETRKVIVDAARMLGLSVASPSP